MSADEGGLIDPGWRTDRMLEAGWLADPAVAEVMGALRGAGFFVGGAVRNTLLGEPAGDIDIATPLTPEEVTARIEAAGLKAVPTGIDHGTVTAVAQHHGFEITSFRADVETDGRRAVVRFSTDLAEDAARRDFTINALYADASGRVIDPLGGLADLAARRIRFIGDPHERIREDYLRILRFFRFVACYGGESGIDAEGLAACAAHLDGLEGLAHERIGGEFRKLLAARDPAPAVAAMAASGVLMRCLPGAEPQFLAPVVHLEAMAGRAPDWLLRLAALGPADPSEALRLSRAEERRLEAIGAALAAGEPADVTAYRHGADTAWAAALLAAAAGAPPDWSATADAIEAGAKARLPVEAADLMAAGLDPGPALGAALERARELWLASGFSLDREALIRQSLD